MIKEENKFSTLGAVALLLTFYNYYNSEYTLMRMLCFAILGVLYVAYFEFLPQVFSVRFRRTKTLVDLIVLLTFVSIALFLVFYKNTDYLKSLFSNILGDNDFYIGIIVVILACFLFVELTVSLPCVRSVFNSIGTQFFFYVFLQPLCRVSEKLWVDSFPLFQGMTRVVLISAAANILAFYSGYIPALRNKIRMLNTQKTNLTNAIFLALFVASYALMYAGNSYITNLVSNYWKIYGSLIRFSIAASLLIFSTQIRRDKNVGLTGLCIIMALSAITYYIFCGDLWILAMYIFAIGAISIDGKKLVLVSIFSGMFISVLAYWLSMNGYVPYVIKESADGIKHAFGFYDANGCSMHLVFILLMYLFLRTRKDLSSIIFDFSICYFVFFFVNRYTCGRTSILGLVYLLIGTAIIDIYKVISLISKKQFFSEGIHKISILWSEGVLLFCFVFSIIFSWIYNSEEEYSFISVMGRFFETSTFKSRLQYGYEGLHTYTPRLFGQIINESNVPGETGFWLDNFYIRALLKYGILLLICFIVLMTVLNIRLWKRKMYYQMFILSSIPIMGVMEALIGDPMYNVFPIVALSVIGNKGLLGDNANKK